MWCEKVLRCDCGVPWFFCVRVCWRPVSPKREKVRASAQTALALFDKKQIHIVPSNGNDNRATKQNSRTKKYLGYVIAFREKKNYFDFQSVSDFR